MNVAPIGQPKFVKETQDMASLRDVQQSFVNIDDIANLRQVNNAYWEADSISHQKYSNGSKVVYRFDNDTAGKILNYKA